MLARLVVNLESRWTGLKTGFDRANNGLRTVADGAVRTVRAIDDLPDRLQQTSGEIGELQKKAVAVHAVTEKLSTASGAMGRGFGRVSDAALVTADSLGIVKTVVDLAAHGLAILLGIVHAGIAAFTSLGVVGKVVFLSLLGIILRFTGLLSGVGGAFARVVKLVYSVIAPIVKLAVAVKNMTQSWRGVTTPLALVYALISYLPPKVRETVGGLVALGAASQSTHWAMRVMSGTVSLTGRALSLLAIPMMAVLHPIISLSRAGRLFAASLRVVGSAATWAAQRLVALGVAAGGAAVNGLRRAGAAADRLAGSLVTRLVKGALLAVTGLVGWGAVLAADAEQAQVAFSTLLGSAEAATAVLQQLQDYSASTPFALGDLRTAAQQLLAVGITTNDLLPSLQMLGELAAGTGRDIGEFADIFAQVRGRGVASLEHVNRLAERGVPIYTALTETLGVSVEELRKLISAGKVGFPELQAALESLTSEGGMFAGGVAAQSQTIYGLLSTLKDNIGFAAMEIANQLLEAFELRDLIGNGIEFAQQVKAWLGSIRPIVFQVADTVRAAFGAAWQIGERVFRSIAGAAGVSGGDIIELIVTALAVAEFAFLNLDAVAGYVWTLIQLGAVSLGEDLRHLFTVGLVTWVMYFAGVVADAMLLVPRTGKAAFENLAANAKAAMTGIWSYIASGGRAQLQIAWVPLGESLEGLVRELPDIPDRALTALEGKLGAAAAKMGDELGTGLAEHVAGALDAARANAAAAEALPVPDITGKSDQPQDDPTAGAGSGGGKQETGARALLKGSAEAFSAIYGALRQNNDPGLKVAEKQLKVQENQAADIATIAGKLQTGSEFVMVAEIA